MIVPGLLAALLCCGCPPPNGTQTIAEAQRLRDLEERTRRLEGDLAARDDVIRRQADQIRELQQQAAGAPAAQLSHASRIELDAMTGGYDADGSPGDDGVVVYVRPYDVDGDSLKAAGSVRVQVLDLAAAGDAQTVGEVSLDAAALRKTWYGKLMTSHYTIRCPWRAGPPQHADLVVRVQFIDLLTGKPFEEVRQVKVRLPAAR